MVLSCGCCIRLVPWVGVIAAGYAFGAVLMLEPERRRRICLAIGLGSIAAFAVLRGLNLYGDPRPWRSGLDVLNATKYPASLSFLLMTLGPTIAVMPLLDNARGAVARWLTVFGRVPFFYYVLHIPLIHVLAIVVSRIRMGEVSDWLFAEPPDGTTAAARGLRMESAAALSRLGDCGGDALRRVPVVRRSQSTPQRLVDEIRLSVARVHARAHPRVLT